VTKGPINSAKAALAFAAQPTVALQAQAASSPVVAAATSAAQVVTSTQPVMPIIVTGTQTLSRKDEQTKLFSQIADRSREQAEYRSHVIKNTGIYKFGKLSYEIAGEGITASTPYVTGFFGGMHQALPYRLIFMFLFFFVFYRIIYNICIFFGIDQIILSMYMGWVSFIIVLFTFLPYDYGNILDE
jgi:hypothetical protein